MKVGVLFSGGKDSCAAAFLAQQYNHEVSCLLSMQSANLDSYMFHTPNKRLVEVQADAMGIPIIIQETQGEKEIELVDLDKLIKKGIKEYDIQGVVTGTIASVYQATRVQKICAELGLTCFNPLWQREEYEHTKWIIEQGFETSICAIAAYPMEQEWLGRKIDTSCLADLYALQKKHKISPAGEGGEFETFVHCGPGWKKRITIKKAESTYDNHAGVWEIIDFALFPIIEKEKNTKNIFLPDRQNKIPNIEQNSYMPILLLSTCKEKLHELEFVLPIKKVLGNAEIKHYAEVELSDIEQSNNIIICGTALADDTYLTHIEHFSWIKDYKNPLLGICAGFQIIAQTFGSTITTNEEIGLLPIHQVTPLGEITEAYFLHHNALAAAPKGFDFIDYNKEIVCINKENMTGILFHPEVRNTHLLKKFLQ